MYSYPTCSTVTAITRGAILALSLTGSLSAHSAKLFTDTQFNSADYGTTTGASLGLTVNIGQSLTGGNSGAYLLSETQLPAGSAPVVTRGFIVNRVHEYNPGISGEVASITYSLDNLVSFNGNLGTNFLVYQGGNYYVHSQNLGAVPANTWVGTGPITLQAIDLSLVTDLGQFKVDNTQHPDFALGDMLFGTFYSIATKELSGTTVVKRGFDNFSVSISAVPENGTLTLSLLGLPLLLRGARLRRERATAQ